MRDELKKKIRAKSLCFGSWVTLKDPTVTEIICQNKNIDWVAIDGEHSSLSMSEISDHIRAASLSRKCPLVRVSENDATEIKRVMDAGAQGIIVPMVGSVADLQKAHSAMHYPPLGTRGMGLGRASRFGEKSAHREYLEWLPRSAVLIAQVESVEALSNIDSITASELIDGIMVGPYDLSASLGIPGRFEHKDFLEAVDRITASARKNDRAMGAHVVEPRAQEIRRAMDRGCTFIAYGTDFRIIESCFDEGLSSFG
ncbi:MAG: aldolase/citrate lyase family protein [Elusimicrobiota bacterium]|nr:aldolase/citrate lyase family protein [Elusimicrobiota bacterium]